MPDYVTDSRGFRARAGELPAGKGRVAARHLVPVVAMVDDEAVGSKRSTLTPGMVRSAPFSFQLAHQWTAARSPAATGVPKRHVAGVGEQAGGAPGVSHAARRAAIRGVWGGAHGRAA